MDVTQYQELVQNYIFQIQQARGKDPAACIRVCNELEQYGSRINDDALIGFAQFSRGETYYLLNDMKNFYKEMFSCLPRMEKIGEWGYVVMANNMLGIMSLNRGNAPFAMDYYIKALAVCERYKLPDMEWLVNMNIGSLYLNIEEYQKALSYIEKAYKYIVSKKNMPGYYESLTSAYIGMGKAHLAMGDNIKAVDLYEKIQRETYGHLQELDKIMVTCYEAIMYHKLDQVVKRDESISKMQNAINMDLPIMDVFDDIFEYLSLLIDIQYYDDFFRVLEVVEQLAKRAAVKNLEIKLLSLKIRYYRDTNQTAEYMQAAVLFYELSERQENENHTMVISMIDLRKDYNNLSNIARQVRMENESLHEKSETDALTGLYNRFRLNTYGEELFQRAIKERMPFAIEILDIDYFKQFNDNYGHQQGDYCLKEIARMISMQKESAADDSVFCARYGGDEFVIIYLGLSLDETKAKAEALKKRICDRSLEHKYSLSSDIVTISQGICWDKPREEDSLTEFLHNADNMLYKVKEYSRNNYKLGRLSQVED